MSIAFIFPGQGSQSVGMGVDLAEAFASAREVFQEIDDALGQKLFALMKEGPEGDLTLTENAQPALMAVSLAVMPFLSWFERRTGRELGSASAVADSKQTLICSYLSAALLVGLLLNSLFGWAWADSIAALAIAAFAIREGLEAWKGEACAVPVSALTGERTVEACDCC